MGVFPTPLCLLQTPTPLFLVMSSTTLEIQRAQAQAREKEHQDKQNELQLEQNELAKIEQSEVENEAAAVSAASGNLKNEVKLCRYCSLGSKHLKRIQQLLRDGVNPNCLVKNTSLSRHETQTQQVASSPDELGFGGMVDMDNLLTKGQLIVEKLGPLHWAARGGHGEVIKVLLANGGDPNLPSEPFEHTPLHVAAVENKSVAIRLLVAGGADLERKTGTHDRKSHPLHMAARLVGGWGWGGGGGGEKWGEGGFGREFLFWCFCFFFIIYLSACFSSFLSP